MSKSLLFIYNFVISKIKVGEYYLWMKQVSAPSLGYSPLSKQVIKKKNVKKKVIKKKVIKEKIVKKKVIKIKALNLKAVNLKILSGKRMTNSIWSVKSIGFL